MKYDVNGRKSYRIGGENSPVSPPSPAKVSDDSVAEDGPDVIPEEKIDLQTTLVEIKKPQCPYCGRTTRQRCIGAPRGSNVRYYQCGWCVYPDGSGDWTRYKAIIMNA